MQTLLASKAQPLSPPACWFGRPGGTGSRCRALAVSSSRAALCRPARQLLAPPLARRRCALACRAHNLISSGDSSSSSSSNSGGSMPSQHALPPPHWLTKALAGAALCAAVFCLSARPARAAGSAAFDAAPSPPPQPSQPAHAVMGETSASYAAAAAQQQQQQQWQPRGWRDTGIQLAENGSKLKEKVEGKPIYVTPEELTQQGNAAITRLMEDAGLSPKEQRPMKRAMLPSKGGRKVDPAKSMVPDPSEIPSPEEFAKTDNFGIVTMWRPDKLRQLTYTQFWNLVRERKVEKVRYADDRRSVWVTTKANAPGGARTEKVGLPFDPQLFDHLVEHGVYIQDDRPNPVMPMLHAIARLVFPIAFSFLLIKFAFRLGQKKDRDRIFGGVNMEMVKAKDAQFSFKDIAGIDQVKLEITELVEFLRDPDRFLNLGARSPAGVLLVGPPGTGKTLLAKAVAGEAGVPFFSIAGTEFMEMFVGVGASRVRDVFKQARANAPCILFIDEFDGIGQARSAAGNDESVHTINQLLTEMDGFEDNTGVIVMAATNRPGALDQALTRAGRFDRIIYMPLPDVEGRIGILQVHARDKRVDPNLDYAKIARATAGCTGADLMNLMNQSAIVAVRQKQPFISEAQVFEALERIQTEKVGQGGTAAAPLEDDLVPPMLRKTIAVYEAARALIAFITPNFDEVQRVSACPGGMATGHTFFLPREETIEARIITQGYMEAKMVVALAGRCAERLVLGEGNVTAAGGGHLQQANIIAREMVFRCGFSKRLGPVYLMDNEESYLRNAGYSIADISTEMAIIAYEEVEELVQAAEAKAYYGLAINYTALVALAEALIEHESLTGAEIRKVLEDNNVTRFGDDSVEGYGWAEDGGLQWPGKPIHDSRELAPQLIEYLEKHPSGNGAPAGHDGEGDGVPTWWSPYNPYTVRTDIADLLMDFPSRGKADDASSASGTSNGTGSAAGNGTGNGTGAWAVPSVVDGAGVEQE